MRAPRDLTGKRFGRLVAIRVVVTSKPKRWDCRCGCGKSLTVLAGNLTHKNYGSRSCGCYRIERISTHRAAHHPLYRTWYNMIDRCYNKRSPDYEHYGARGIKVCNRWRNDPHAFFADVGPKPSSAYTVDRRDNDGDYDPANCRWATHAEQNGNRSICQRLTMNGVTRSLSEWAATIGVEGGTLARRLRCGWSVERTLSTPVANRRKVATRSSKQSHEDQR